MRKFGSKSKSYSKLTVGIHNESLTGSTPGSTLEGNYYSNDFFEKDIFEKLYKSNVIFSECQMKESNYLFKAKGVKWEDKNQTKPGVYAAADTNKTFSKEKKVFGIDVKRLSELEEGNLYFTLGVEENSDKESIKRAYRNLCKIYHPDKGGDASHFDRVRRAYEVLSNDICRKLYDRFSSGASSLIDFILSQKDGTGIDLDSSVLDNEDLEVIRILLHQK